MKLKVSWNPQKSSFHCCILLFQVFDSLVYNQIDIVQHLAACLRKIPVYVAVGSINYPATLTVLQSYTVSFIRTQNRHKHMYNNKVKFYLSLSFNLTIQNTIHIDRSPPPHTQSLAKINVTLFCFSIIIFCNELVKHQRLKFSQ